MQTVCPIASRFMVILRVGKGDEHYEAQGGRLISMSRVAVLIEIMSGSCLYLPREYGWVA